MHPFSAGGYVACATAFSGNLRLRSARSCSAIESEASARECCAAHIFLACARAFIIGRSAAKEDQRQGADPEVQQDRVRVSDCAAAEAEQQAA